MSYHLELEDIQERVAKGEKYGEEDISELTHTRHPLTIKGTHYDLANDQQGNCVYIRWLPSHVYELLKDDPDLIDDEIKNYKKLYKLQEEISDLAEEYVTNEEDGNEHTILVEEKLEILREILDNMEEGVEEIVIEGETQPYGDYSFITDAFKKHCRVAVRVEPNELIISLAKISTLDL